MKTQEELNSLKEEVETVSRKLAELTEDELKSVTGGAPAPILDHGSRPCHVDPDFNQSRLVTCPFCKHDFWANHNSYNYFCPNCCQTFVG